jgi:hypothetical protein
MDTPQRNSFNNVIKFCTVFIIYYIVALIVTTVMFFKNIIIIFINAMYSKPSLFIWIIFYCYVIEACFFE